MRKAPVILLAGLGLLLSACSGDTAGPGQQVPLLKQGAPGAPPPDVFKGTNVPTSYVDDFLCRYGPFDFDVQIDGDDTYNMTIYYNPDTSPARITWQDNFQGTATGLVPGGVTLRKHSAGNIIYDYNGGTDTFKGLAAQYKPLNGGPPIDVDAGYIKFDINGVLKDAGKHPLFLGPGNDAVCNALAGN